MKPKLKLVNNVVPEVKTYNLKQIIFTSVTIMMLISTVVFFNIHPIGSQAFVSILLFLTFIAALLFVIGGMGMIITKTEKGKCLFRFVTFLGVILTFVVAYCAYEVLKYQTNQKVVHSISR